MRLEGLSLDRYHLQEKIGEGGGGEVYRAKDTHMSMDREVAVKVIALPDDVNEIKLIMELFQREVQAITRLNHPHILPIYDYGVEPRTRFAYMVMPFFQQGSLTSWRQERILSPHVVLHFLHQATNALQQVHDQKIVHKDIKPQNFLIRKNIDNPDLPDLLLTDFGVVKLNTAVVSLGNLLGGTPLYMAPEQWERKPVYASDQYSLAVMAYELLTGHLPFQGKSIEELESKHHTDQPKAPSMLCSNISIAIDKVILRALAKKPEHRFSSVSEFYEAFEHAVQSSQKGTDIHVILVISETDAQIGTENLLTLPGRRKIAVNVPAKTPNGHVISLEGQGEQSPYNGPAGTLFITIVTKHDISSEQRVIKQLQGLTERLDDLKADVSKNQATATQIISLSRKVRNLQKIFTNQEQFESRLSRWLIILCIALTIFVIGGSVNIFYLSHRLTTTTTSIPVSIAQVGTAVAYANATATTVAANPYPSYLPGKGTLVLYDSMHDKSQRGGWNEWSDNNFGGSCQFKGAAFHVSQSKPNRFFICTASSNFNNFAIEVQMNIIKGDGGGLGFRGDGNLSYYFFVHQDGSYHLSLYRDETSKNAKVLSSDLNLFIKPGLNQINLLAVVAQGNNIVLYVNHQQIANVHDNNSSHGNISVLADEDSEQTEVLYNNVKVWTL